MSDSLRNKLLVAILLAFAAWMCISNNARLTQGLSRSVARSAISRVYFPNDDSVDYSAEAKRQIDAQVARHGTVLSVEIEGCSPVMLSNRSFCVALVRRLNAEFRETLQIQQGKVISFSAEDTGTLTLPNDAP